MFRVCVSVVRFVSYLSCWSFGSFVAVCGHVSKSCSLLNSSSGRPLVLKISFATTALSTANILAVRTYPRVLGVWSLQVGVAWTPARGAWTGKEQLIKISSIWRGRVQGLWTFFARSTTMLCSLDLLVLLEMHTYFLLNFSSSNQKNMLKNERTKKYCYRVLLSKDNFFG